MTDPSKDVLIKIESHQVPQLSVKKRLQEYGVGIFTTLVSRSGVKKAIKKGLIFINSERGYTGDWIEGGEVIELHRKLDPYKPDLELDLEVLFEDDFLAFINKPAGVLVSGNKHFTIANALRFNLKPSNQADALPQPEPVHRLDYPTTGALLVGKTAGMLKALNTLFENRQILKSYVAVTKGAMKERGTMVSPVDEKPSRSDYEKIASIASVRYEVLNLLRLTPHTGRRHQLRKHLADLGHPIFGDVKYGGPGTVSKGNGLYLHALSVSFTHPVTKSQLMVCATPPKKFLKIFPEAGSALGIERATA